MDDLNIVVTVCRDTHPLYSSIDPPLQPTAYLIHGGPETPLYHYVHIAAVFVYMYK